MKWQEFAEICRWRMVPNEHWDVYRCSALQGTGMGCCEGMCALWQIYLLPHKSGDDSA
jgi:hypothetical protein